MKYLIRLSNGQEITKEAAKIQVGFAGIRGFNEQGTPVFHYSNVSSWEVVEDTPGQTTRLTDKSCCNHGKEPLTAQDILDSLADLTTPDTPENTLQDMVDEIEREIAEFFSIPPWILSGKQQVPEKTLPARPRGIPEVKEGWTYVGGGNLENTEISSLIAMYMPIPHGGWYYEGVYKGRWPAQHYAVRNDAPDEIWARFGFTGNPVLLQASRGAFKHDPDDKDNWVFRKWHRDVQREIKGCDLRITQASRNPNKLPDGNRCMSYTVTMETTDGKHRSTGETFHKYPWEIKGTRVLENIRAHLETVAELVRSKVKKEADEEARRKAEEDLIEIARTTIRANWGSPGRHTVLSLVSMKPTGAESMYTLEVLAVSKGVEPVSYKYELQLDSYNILDNLNTSIIELLRDERKRTERLTSSDNKRDSRKVWAFVCKPERPVEVRRVRFTAATDGDPEYPHVYDSAGNLVMCSHLFVERRYAHRMPKGMYKIHARNHVEDWTEVYTTHLEVEGPMVKVGTLEDGYSVYVAQDYLRNT